MSYVGNTPTQQAFTAAIDYFSGNGSTVAFTLSRPVASVAQVQVNVNNVAQNPSTAFTVSGNTITFTGAPSSGTNNIYVQYTSSITQIMQPGQGTVGNTQLVSGAAVSNIGYTPVNKAGDTMTGALTVQSGGVTLQTNDANGYARLTQSSGSVQLGLFRSSTSAGGGYIGADSDNCLDVRTASFTTRLRVSQSGYVTAPQQPFFVAKFSITKSNSTSSPMLFDAVGFNVGGHYNGSTGVFTAPVAGRYQINVMALRQTGGSSYLNLKVAINGAAQSGTYGDIYTNDLTGEIGISGGWVVNLNANDAFAVWYGSAATVTFYSTETAVSGYLLG